MPIEFGAGHPLGLIAGRESEWADRVAVFASGVDWPAERKPLSVSFHFRRADDEAAARAYLTRVEAAARAEGLVPRWASSLTMRLSAISMIVRSGGGKKSLKDSCHL